MKKLNQYFSLFTQMKFLVFLMGKLKIPMIGYVKPKLLELDDNSVKLKIKLRRRTKNHLNSMYFGVLAVGADLAAGAHAFYYAKKEGLKIPFAFKNFNADFIKRPETDVIFVMNQGLEIKAAFEQAKKEQSRINKKVEVIAYNLAGEEVAIFELTASIKCI